MSIETVELDVGKNKCGCHITHNSKGTIDMVLCEKHEKNKHLKRFLIKPITVKETGKSS